MNNSSISWKASTDNFFAESNFLSLDSTKARLELEWSNMLDLDETLLWTSNWYKEVRDGKNPYDVVLNQVKRYLEIKEIKENSFEI